jgi:hypothetical protein
MYLYKTKLAWLSLVVELILHSASGWPRGVPPNVE